MACLMRFATLRPTPLRASRTCTPIKPSHLVSRPSLSHLVSGRDVRVLASAEKTEGDFDAMLAKWADQFEKADNKPAIVGYLSAAVGAVIFAEWFIHLPALDILIGFPIQLLGLFSLPVLATRYLLDGKADAREDAAAVVNSIAAKLPGLKKE